MEQTEKVEPEIQALRDNLVRYEIAAASERQERDRLIATWRDILHYSLQSPGAVGMIHSIHMVIESMDDFLNRAGGRRK